MITLSTAALAATLIAAPLAGPHQGRQSPAPQRAGGSDEVLVHVTRVMVPSQVFHAAREVDVWLPAAEGFSADRYPVLVFPDAEETGQFRAALANIQFLINRQLIPPIMVVGVPYFANRRHELTPPATGETAQLYPAAGGADDNLRFIADELLPWIDARYPTARNRLLVGHSLGGLFALYAMKARPDLFRVVVALSPLMYWNDGALNDPVAAAIAADTSRARVLFLASGGLEPSIDSSTTAFATRLQAVLDSVRPANLRYERQRYPRDTHEMVTLPGLVDGLRMAFEPLFVPLDSLVDALNARPERDSAEIAAIARGLQSRYAAAAAEAGSPAPFPEAALDLLGRFALLRRSPALAATLLRENARRYPHSSGAHAHLGDALAAAGDTASAVTELRTALAIAQDSLRTTTSVISRTRETGVRTAVQNRLRAMHRETTR